MSSGRAYRAAYGIDALTNSQGPQCSGHPEFCFFCNFESDPQAQGSSCDLYSVLVDLVKQLAQQKKAHDHCRVCPPVL